MSRKRGKESRGTALNKHPILFLLLGLFEALTLVLTQLDKRASAALTISTSCLGCLSLCFCFRELLGLSRELAHEPLEKKVFEADSEESC